MGKYICAVAYLCHGWALKIIFEFGMTDHDDSENAAALPDNFDKTLL
jgi:hypothetical protein